MMRRALTIVTAIFFACLFSLVIIALVDAASPFPLADYVVKKLGDTMSICVTAIIGLLVGQGLGSRQQ